MIGPAPAADLPVEGAPGTVLASSTRGMVTSPHTLASEAGLKVLREGGNAIEAAIAMGGVIAVTYPHFCGIGGDAIWIIADREGRATTLTGIGQAAAAPPACRGTIPTRGALSTLASACVVDTWRLAHDFSRQHWGGGNSLASLLDPAIGYAEDGFPLTESQSFWTQFRLADLPGWPGFVRTFLHEGRVPQCGEPFLQKALARSLRLIASNGPRDFYEGELAASLAKGLAEVGSPLTAEDLRRTVAREEAPVALEYRGLTLLAPPPPTQGVTTLAIMGVLERLGLGGVEEGSADYFHRCVESVKQAFLDRDTIGDPAFAAPAADLWIGADRLAAKAAMVDLDRALDWPQTFRTGDTVFFGATDPQGHSVSVLQSTYFDWGSGVVVGDTGVLWQNRGAAFSLDPSSPNRLAPGKRPFYTLNPGMALKGGRPHILYGTQGADGQPQTLSVLLTRLIDYGLDPAEALSRPRFLLGRTFSDDRHSLKLESRVNPHVIASLRERGHQISLVAALSPLAGQAGAIVIDDDGDITGAHDPRSDGVALGL